MLIKLIFIGLIIYFASKIVNNLLKPSQPQSKVEGSPQNNDDLDLSNADIEDADFEEIDKD